MGASMTNGFISESRSNARLAPSRMRFWDALGVRLRAEKGLFAHLVITRSAQGIRAPTSASTVSSPQTSATGTPRCPASRVEAWLPT